MYLRPDVAVVSAGDQRQSEVVVYVYWDFGQRRATLSLPSSDADILIQAVGGLEDLKLRDLTFEREITRFLVDRDLIVSSRSSRSGRFARQEMLWKGLFPSRADGETQRILSNSRVAVIGLGGVGSNLAQALSIAGIGNLYLLDCDVVEESNLNRQVPFIVPPAVGQQKTDALASWIEVSSSRHINVQAATTRFSGGAANSVAEWRPDIVVIAADEPSVFHNLIISINEIPRVDHLIGGGYIGPSAFAGPLLRGKGGHCINCMSLNLAPAKIEIGHKHLGGNFLSTVQWVTGVALSSVLFQLVDPDGPNPCFERMLSMNLRTGDSGTRPFEKCGTCQS